MLLSQAEVYHSRHEPTCTLTQSNTQQEAGSNNVFYCRSYEEMTKMMIMMQTKTTKDDTFI